MEAAIESVGLAKGVVDTAYARLQNVRMLSSKYETSR